MKVHFISSRLKSVNINAKIHCLRAASAYNLNEMVVEGRREKKRAKKKEKKRKNYCISSVENALYYPGAF